MLSFLYIFVYRSLSHHPHDVQVNPIWKCYCWRYKVITKFNLHFGLKNSMVLDEVWTYLYIFMIQVSQRLTEVVLHKTHNNVH